MAKAIRVKPKPPEEKSSTGDKEDRRISYNFEFRHQFIVGIRMLESGVTYEQVQQDILDMLRAKYPGGVFTPSGGYILIDGKACYPGDFDYETRDRRPGTRPPLYTLTAEEQREIGLLDRIERERKREIQTGNGLATNPTHLLTAPEVDRLKKFREKQGTSKEAERRPVRVKSGSATGRTSSGQPVTVEWTEKDAGNEDLVAEETAKILGKMPLTPRRVKVRKRT